MKTDANFLLGAASLLACASIIPTVSAADTVPASEPSRPLYRPLSLGLDAGTTGFGGAVSWRFADHWGARLGLDFVRWSESGVAIENINYDAKLRLLSEPLTLDIYPWKKRSFHISAGVMFNQFEATGTGYATGPSGTFRSVEATVREHPVSGYLSIGGNFFYFDRAHHWAMGGELGVAYTGVPNVSLSRANGSGLSDDAVNNAKQKLHDYVNQYKWWPVVKLKVTYSF